MRPAAWGMTAALAGIMAANGFYLTMTFYYFYVFLMLIAALPIIFGRAGRAKRRPGVPRSHARAGQVPTGQRLFPATS